jgi:UDP:flavonoid glycosyltransferase YjiC (YdhE family)
LAGKPLLLLPLNIEQRMLSTRVVESGAGLAAPGFAERYAGLAVEHIPERFAVLVEKLLASEAL